MESLRILRRQEVQHIVGLSRSAIYAAILRGDFPKSVKIGRRAVGWTNMSISAWLDERQKKEEK